ncbi:MAG: outer membrane lipoprotein-sorting protein [Gemmatimonadota bacterium]|nr:outer membrane lipoprotein-sorting protein [Gemmatimonadota bacterium]
MLSARTLALTGLILAAAGGAPAEEIREIQVLVDRMDRLYRSETSYAELEMEIRTPHWRRTLRMKMWTEGMRKTFVTILAPKKEAGTSTLRVGAEMWNYFPRINKVIKVPPSMMMGSWMGSDFTNDDLVKESSLAVDYQPAFGTTGNDSMYEIVLIPREETPTVWGRIVLTIRKSDLIPVSYVYFDESGDPMREMTLSGPRDFGGRTLPAVLEMKPLKKEGHRTVIRYLDAQFDRGLPKDTFTRRNLRRRR